MSSETVGQPVTGQCSLLEDGEASLSWQLSNRLSTHVFQMPTALHEDTTDLDQNPHQVSRWKLYKQRIKIGMLLVLWSFFTFFLVVSPIKVVETSVVTIMPKETVVRTLRLGSYAVKVTLKGPIDVRRQKSPVKGGNVVGVHVHWLDSISNRSVDHSVVWNVYLEEKEFNEIVTVSKVFFNPSTWSSDLYGQLWLHSKCVFPVALVMETDSAPMYTDYGLLYCALLVLGLFILMCFEMTDPTLSVLLMSTAGLGTLSALGERPSLLLITSWVNVRVLLLMLSLMIISGITSETGVFDWLVVQTYRISKGHRWLTLFFLAIMTAVLSSIIPNVTIVFLMCPIAILLCEVIPAQTPLFVVVVIFYSNLGGALTLVGDPLTMNIATHTNVDFGGYTLHMFPGVLCAVLVGLPVVYLTMRRNLHLVQDHQNKLIAKREAKREARPLLSREVAELEAWLRKRHPARSCIRPSTKYFEKLAYLKIHYGIRDKLLLAKSLIVVLFVQISFMVHSQPTSGGSLHMSALMGAILLIILTKLDELDKVWNYLDWSVLLFLGGHFVFIAVVLELGLVNWLGDMAVRVISSVGKDHQKTVALLLVVWLTAFLAALVNNIAVTEMLLRLIKDLSENINIPLSPLIWALSYGACFGANGSLLGAQANLIGVVIARRFGYHITFLQFSRYGVPVMLASLTLASAYLLILTRTF